jgi:hypothetical protein
MKREEQNEKTGMRQKIKPPSALAGGGLGGAQSQNWFVRLLFPRADWSR